MEKWIITGVHHISLKPADVAEFERVVDFYHTVLGLELHDRWQNDKGIHYAMVWTGNAYLEIVSNGTSPKDLNGGLDHIALSTDQVDAVVEAVQGAGYEITLEPREAVLGITPPQPIRIAFCRGPLGELVEFFHVK